MTLEDHIDNFLTDRNILLFRDDVEDLTQEIKKYIIDRYDIFSDSIGDLEEFGDDGVEYRIRDMLGKL